MYTEGIRKIYCNIPDTIPKPRIATLCRMAEAAGYNALSFNGDIFVWIKEDDFDAWVRTDFRLTDFQDI